MEQSNVFHEANFTRADQNVEKAVVDLFQETEADGNISNIHFVGALHKFNAMFAGNSQTYAHEDILRLPKP